MRWIFHMPMSTFPVFCPLFSCTLTSDNLSARFTPLHICVLRSHSLNFFIFGSCYWFHLGGLRYGSSSSVGFMFSCFYAGFCFLSLLWTSVLDALVVFSTCTICTSAPLVRFPLSQFSGSLPYFWLRGYFPDWMVCPIPIRLCLALLLIDASKQSIYS